MFMSILILATAFSYSFNLAWFCSRIASSSFFFASNVSFINTIVNRKNIARTSSKPGKTTTLNFYQVNKEFYIVDVPGYGYAATNKKQIEKFGIMIEEYLKTRQYLKHVFLLVDYRHKPTEDDVLMYKFLKYYNLPVTVIATKADKVGGSKKEKSLRDIFLNHTYIIFSMINLKLPNLYLSCNMGIESSNTR